MKSKVVSALSDFLGALCYQVEDWDHKAVDALINDAHLFQAFQSGNDFAKWCIYARFKHTASAYTG